MERNVSAGVIAKKCRCGSTWCPDCGKIKMVYFLRDRLSTFDWRYTREIILTIDPKKIGRAEDALELIIKKRRQLIDDLKRREGIEIIDWFGVLEWYRSGYPHCHILVMVSKPGRLGMIGGERLYGNWEYGIIKENYFRNKRHWDNKIGYAAKVGYFCKGKEYQTRLPWWAAIDNKVIRRVFGQTITKEIEKEKARERINSNGVERVRRPYKLIFESCGKKTKVCVWYKGIIHPTGVIDVEFKKIKEILGECEYRQGIGLIKKMSQDELFDFLEKYDLNDVLMQIEAMIMRYHRCRGEFYEK